MTTTFTTNSVYESNLKLLLSSLSSGADRGNGFYNYTEGEEANKVYGLFLCRGDLNNSVCQECVTVATRDVTQRCPVEKETIIWYDECLLRYSNRSFFSTVETNPSVLLYNTANYTGIDWFEELLANLTGNAADEAANSPMKFATRKENFASRKNNVTEYESLYGLLQCTQDLSGLDCNRCLREAIANLPWCCPRRRAARVMFPSCNIQYGLDPFYNEDWIIATAPRAPATPPLLSPPTPHLSPPTPGL